MGRSRHFAFLQDGRLWLLFGVILLSRLALLLWAQWLAGDDGPRYLQEALNLERFGIFSSLSATPPAPTAHDLPVFPAILAGMVRVLPDLHAAEVATGVLNAIFFSIGGVAVYGLSLSLRQSRTVAAFATLIFALFPETFPYSLFYMPDSLFVAAFLWAVLLTAVAIEKRSGALLLCGFGLLAFSALVKPASLFFGFVLGIWVLVFWAGTSIRHRAGWVAAGLAIELLVFAPWMARNQRDFGHPVLTTITGTNLFDNYHMLLEDMHVPDVDAKLEAVASEAARKAGTAWENPVERSFILGNLASRGMRSHWGRYLWTTAKRHPRLYLGTGTLALVRLVGDDRAAAALDKWQAHPTLAGAKSLPPAVLTLQLASWALLIGVYGMALLGLLDTFRYRRWFALVIPLSTLLYFAAIIGPMTYTRYRMPMAPFFSQFAAYGCCRVFAMLALSKPRERRLRPAVAAANT